MVTRPELRARARASLQGNWGRAILILIVMGLMTFIPDLILTRIHPYAQYVFIFIVSGPLGYGAAAAFLSLARNNRPSVSLLFEGFEHFTKTFLLYLLLSVFTFLWMLLLIVPGIIATYRYSQAYYILRDNPEISALEAIQRSKEMMVGHKWRLFVLHLSFIGWMLLAILTCGIGFLWLNSYFLTTMAHFYLDLKGNSASYDTQTPPPAYNS
ncbi:hypothetical protein Back11_29080 [Paenibacillus baekrokdamisoli]|uniref:Uncharacterized protein n=1 Tax=Paenibacillus baekrokdamisoli TaxID=1712516 RepID=A0A3G9J9K5_9BACL|nr:DUF975 family protein [Paenibacillus baekrokdamisoli]MBB3071144.1 putative membrane protein [Paenibacillus baekrokdamisoli]BBH21563.1 hypothetical protein Back11_29080 [Paenibacillus baekrokdamisoli]